MDAMLIKKRAQWEKGGLIIRGPVHIAIILEKAWDLVDKKQRSFMRMMIAKKTTKRGGGT